MAMIKCPECGKLYSERADKCPNCFCPNDYKTIVELEETQQEINNSVKINLGKEFFVRIIVLIVAMIFFIFSRNFLINDSHIHEFWENTEAFLLILFLVSSIAVHIEEDGISGIITGILNGILTIFIVGIAFWALESNAFIKNNSELIVRILLIIVDSLYIFGIIPQFIKYNIIKKDVDLNELAK